MGKKERKRKMDKEGLKRYDTVILFVSDSHPSMKKNICKIGWDKKKEGMEKKNVFTNAITCSSVIYKRKWRRINGLNS